jgi:transcriptional regulator with GAF, ATPase, and Fis domain
MIPVLFVELNRARLELRRGLPDQALEIADRAAPGLTKKHLATWINLHMYRSQALAELGRFDEAEQAARIASESAQSQDDETFKGEVLLYGGIVDRLSGRRTRGREKLDVAVEIFEKHGQRHYGARARLERAEALAIDPDALKEALEDARASAQVFESLGMAPFLTRAHRLRDRLEEAVRRGADAPRELLTLYRLARILSASSDLPALLQEILDAAIGLVGAERGVIFIKRVDGEGAALELGASRHVSAEETKDVRKTSQGIVRRALKDDSPLLSRDAMTDFRLRSLKSVIRFEIRSVICAAIRTNDRVIGTIYVDHRKPDRFGERESEFLRALAGFAAPAILAADARRRLEVEVGGLKRAAVVGALAYPLSSLIGESEAMQEVRSLVERYARTRSNLLLLGETGTGKDLVARVLHHAGDRGANLFQPVGGTELQGDIGQSSLRGILKGTATGVDSRPGKFEIANGGTLYIHEIEALPLETQASLLRVIEERKVERIGGTTAIDVDVRLITATSADLLALVKQGFFRSDLYYRLNVVRIEIPALRHRRQDIAPLLHHYLNFFSAEMEVPPLPISSTVLKEYEAYPWPGNVRELRHFVERAVALGGKEFPHLEELAGNELIGHACHWVEDLSAADEKLDSFCAMYAERVFDRCGGVHKRACEILGISYRTLKRFLKMRGRGARISSR